MNACGSLGSACVACLAGQASTGTAGADALCTLAAQAALKGGTWKAWVSSSSQSALSRMGDVGPWYQQQADGGFVRTFNNKANLATAPLVGLFVDENGQDLGSVEYWTGTAAGGTPYSSNCANFSSTSGSPSYGTTGYSGATSSDWTEGGTVYCYETAHLLCFEQ